MRPEEWEGGQVTDRRQKLMLLDTASPYFRMCTYDRDAA